MVNGTKQFSSFYDGFTCRPIITARDCVLCELIELADFDVHWHLAYFTLTKTQNRCSLVTASKQLWQMQLDNSRSRSYKKCDFPKERVITVYENRAISESSMNIHSALAAVGRGRWNDSCIPIRTHIPRNFGRVKQVQIFVHCFWRILLFI